MSEKIRTEKVAVTINGRRSIVKLEAWENWDAPHGEANPYGAEPWQVTVVGPKDVIDWLMTEVPALVQTQFGGD